MSLAFLRNKKGSALLVALLIMGILVAISVVLSILVLREARVTKDLVDSGKAYYTAESGVEIALYNLKHNLPGWEPSYEGDRQEKSFYVGVNDAGNFTSVGELTIDNRCQAYPCFDEDFDVTDVPAEAFYGVLELNEAVTIPLFYVDETGSEVPAGDFVVEYFTNFNPSEHLVISLDELSGWDVLRWKVFGIRKTDPRRTETISDFTAVKSAQVSIYGSDGDEAGGGGDSAAINTNATVPSWFGSREEGCEHADRYTQAIICGVYQGVNNDDGVDVRDEGSISVEGGAVADLSEYKQRADVYDVICWPYEAREYYNYQYLGDDRSLDSEDIHDCYRIDTFMDEHDLKYLTLTNLVNPAVFKPEIQSDKDKKAALSRLYYRVEFFEDGQTPDGVETGNQTVREYASITSRGYSGDNAQSINVQIKRDSFMPVFNFSLYSTYKGDKDFSDFYEVPDPDA